MIEVERGKGRGIKVSGVLETAGLEKKICFVGGATEENMPTSPHLVEIFLPENLKKYWLPWLQISVGYAARNLFAFHEFPEKQNEYSKITDVQTDEVWGSPRYIIALDYDLYKILPDGGSFWMWLKQSLQHFKLPSPAIEFSASKTKFYLVYPFSF